MAPVKGLQVAGVEVFDGNNCLKVGNCGGFGDGSLESDMLLREVKSNV